MSSSLQTRLLEDTVQSARCQVVARLAGNRDSAGLGGMRELAMASANGDDLPAIGVQLAEDFADLHHARISGAPDIASLEPVHGALDGDTNCP